VIADTAPDRVLERTQNPNELRKENQMDSQKGQGADGPERKSVSDRKRTANRKNAQKSTGPKTRAGKEKSKMNAVTHGLLAEDLLITSGEVTEDPEAFGQLLAGAREHVAPVGSFEDAWVQKIAGYMWKDRRVQRFEAGAIQREIEGQRRLETVRDTARRHQALDSNEYLEGSSQGIQQLLEGLERAIEEVQRVDWSIDSYKFIRKHFGHLISLPQEAPRTAGGQTTLGEPDDFDPKQLLKDLKAERDQLRTRLPEVEATEKYEGDARVRSYTLPNARDLDLLLRYDTANDRKLHRAIRQLRQIQADRRAAEAAADTAGDDRPAAE
jgi:hypothetical protein